MKEFGEPRTLSNLKGYPESLKTKRLLPQLVKRLGFVIYTHSKI